MGLFDNIGSALKGVVGQVVAAEAPVVDKLQQGGPNEQVQSWLGNGTNLPVTADQIRSALGNQQVQQLAQHFGLPVDAVLKLLAEHLPPTVDQASPNGTLQPA